MVRKCSILPKFVPICLHCRVSEVRVGYPDNETLEITGYSASPPSITCNTIHGNIPFVLNSIDLRPSLMACSEPSLSWVCGASSFCTA